MDPILQFFEYAHLPQRLQDVSKRFYDLAFDISVFYPKNSERDVVLRKLLEAKDAAVRTYVYKELGQTP